MERHWEHSVWRRIVHARDGIPIEGEAEPTGGLAAEEKQKRRDGFTGLGEPT